MISIVWFAFSSIILLPSTRKPRVKRENDFCQTTGGKAKQYLVFRGTSINVVVVDVADKRKERNSIRRCPKLLTQTIFTRPHRCTFAPKHQTAFVISFSLNDATNKRPCRRGNIHPRLMTLNTLSRAASGKKSMSMTCIRDN